MPPRSTWGKPPQSNDVSGIAPTECDHDGAFARAAFLVEHVQLGGDRAGLAFVLGGQQAHAEIGAADIGAERREQFAADAGMAG